MALAIISQLDQIQEANQEEVRLFEVQIGSNRYYRYFIGEEERHKKQGIEVLTHQHHRSPLMGPVPAMNKGRAVLSIPVRLLDRENRYIQLTSFYDPELNNPKWSEIISVYDYQPQQGLPNVMSMSIPDSINTSFSYKEITDKSYAKSFLGGLVKQVLPSLIPVAIDVLKKAGGSNSSSQNSQDDSGGIMSKLGGLLKNEGLLDLIQQYLGGGGSNEASNQQSLSHAQAVPIPPQVIGQIASSAEKVAPVVFDFMKNLLGLNVDMNVSVEDMTDFGSDTQKTLQTLLMANQIAKLSGQQNQQQQPRSVPIAKAQSFKTLSLQQMKEMGLEFIPTDRVELSLAENYQPEAVNNMASLQYAAGRDLTFPIMVKTPKPIKKAVLRVYIKEVVQNKVVAKKQFRLNNIEKGPLNAEIKLTANELQHLRINEEHTICFRLIFLNKKGQRIGTALTKVMNLVSDFTFDKIGKTLGDTTPLNDIKQHRAFWHKVWAKSLVDGGTEYMMDAKYYYTLNPVANENARMETISKFDPMQAGTLSGKMKSGMQLSLKVLNALIPMVSNKPALDKDQLMALSSSGFKNAISMKARKKLRIWGAGGDSVALWVWPEFQLAEIHLKQAQNINVNGLIENFTDKVIHFPIPLAVHFVGTKLT